jgi:tRNA dimethylallyltransferase
MTDSCRQLAVDLASRFNGEIINGDAMQMYRGLPIITNQIPTEERNGIPHHLLSCIDPDAEAWRVGLFKREALRIIDDIRSRGKVPILVGGTHYYTQAVLFKDQLVGEGVDDEGEREQLTEFSSTSSKWPILDESTEVLLEKLREVDPVMAGRWHPKDGRRIRRSLEIFFQTGRPASEIYKEQMTQKRKAMDQSDSLLRFPNTLVFWVHAEKEVLNARLDARVDDMVKQGLMTEAQKMSDYLQEKASQGVEVDQTRGVWVSIGFKELANYFEVARKGEQSEKELEDLKRASLEQIRTATRQYGSSQVKWIRNKLWRALTEAGETNRLYLLDSSNVSNWSECITQPSEKIVQMMLQNEPTPDPKSLSQLAATEFGAKEAQVKAPKELIGKVYTCECCKKTLAGEDQWNIHLDSYQHKRGLKSAKKREARDEYFRQKELEAQEAAVNEKLEQGPENGS